MNIRQTYTNWSSTYDSDRNLTRDLDQAVTRDALSGVRCRSVLEIGCGTGKNTQLLAEIGEVVHAIDFSEGMIRRAKAKLPLANVIFSVADITKPWPCRERSVDLIACNLVLEHVQDLSLVFSEASRALANGGRFLVAELHPSRQEQGARATFQRELERTEILAFVHPLSDFVHAAREHGLTLRGTREWWHEEDQGKPPRLVSFLFEK